MPTESSLYTPMSFYAPPPNLGVALPPLKWVDTIQCDVLSLKFDLPLALILIILLDASFAMPNPL